MWRKDEPNKPQSSSDPVPLGVSSGEPPASGQTASLNEPATVSHGIRIKGEISGRGDLFWDGVLEGKIHIIDGNFTVGRNARVNAEIEAREIIIHGEVTGALRGERVQVSNTGKVTGDMETKGIVIEDGAMLHSKVRVRRDDEPQPVRRGTPPRARQAAATASGSRPGTQDGEPNSEA